MPPTACPDVRNLEALLEEARAESESDDLSRHLESCPECRQTLENLAAESAVWEDARGLEDSAGMEPALRHLVERLKREDHLGAEDLSFLRPANKPGLLGLLGPYEVLGEIGRGGMGVVLKAVDPALNRVAAVKVLSPYRASSATARRRFVREAQAAAAVCHDHIVPVYGVYEVDGLPYLVMQYVAGESLQDRLDRIGPLEVAEIVRIGLQTALGLAAAHAQGLIHRDIKPANLLLSCSRDALAERGMPPRSASASRLHEFVVKITDFGLARMVDDASLTQNGVVVGTPEYMAPEQARGEAVDHRADLFSLGSVLYAMCTGTPPFRGSSTVAVLRQVSDERPAPVLSLNPNTPAWLALLIERLMAKNQAERFQSASEVAQLLEGCLAHLLQPLTVRAPRLPIPGANACPGPTHPGNRARRMMLPAFVLAGLMLVGFGFRLWWVDPAKTSNETVLQKMAPLAGAEPPAPPSPQPPPLFQQNFRGRKMDDQFLTFTGAVEQIKEEPEGLRITFSGEKTNPLPTGILTRFSVKGDCAITVSYEVLRMDRPARGNGVGVSLFASINNRAREGVMLGRFQQPDGVFFLCQRGFTNAEGKREYPTGIIPTEARGGRLRMVRRGRVAACLVAEDASEEFRQVHLYGIDAADFASVRVGVEGNLATPIDVRIRDLEIRTQDALNEIPAFQPGDVSLEPQEKATPGESRPTATLLGFALAVPAVLLGGVWLYMRHYHAVRQAPAREAVPDVVAQTGTAPLSFRCPVCGKKLRAKAELAGKKVHCSGCGKPVAVPEVRTGDSSTSPS